MSSWHPKHPHPDGTPCANPKAQVMPSDLSREPTRERGRKIALRENETRSRGAQKGKTRGLSADLLDEVSMIESTQ